MNKYSIAALFFIILTASSIFAIHPAKAATDSWVSKAPMHVSRASLGVAAVNGKIYAIGGTNQTLQSTPLAGLVAYDGIVGVNEQYDPLTNTWTFKSPMPTPRYGFAIAVYNNQIYCIGGSTANRSSTVNEVYDPSLDQWTIKAPIPENALPLFANVISDKIYVIGGAATGNLYFTSVYDPTTDSWTAKTPRPYSTSRYVSTGLDDKIYVLGGLDLQAAGAPANQIYQTQSDTWSVGTGPPMTNYGGRAVATSGVFAPKRIYLMGMGASGINQTLYPNEAYDPTQDNWTLGVSMPSGRSDFGLAVLDDIIYAIGGYEWTIMPNGSPDAPLIPSTKNERYTPIGYVAPTPTPSPTPSLSPSPKETPSPFATEQPPTPSNSLYPTDKNLDVLTYTYWIAGATIIAVTVIGAFLLFTTRKNILKSN